ncbi:murein biosynthesis integral membrane protein MurJ [Cellulomonas dongxiuzhuiae]|uniref:Murein biosynthesis integral membrane protein MurJ n=1 Tax=Cellulomonas dongxiuzhuiae TaxID=2819979 RepID=A0ABX8GJI4_9CELL|nr:murein biosynthesis integral membrane protein MurJ [Cellulomonas dongxiuzhuiae]MBO3089125.1 murein biosynthesis integral membrane protein MurJ [Cellulomonas dongxiuzhuiae]MBO3095094.1 murein biosynthesis integral membrane protein MurJ [Cellulomonas dongxiuzhuiae]QWC16105.1 murein biosynthesis integral membrane protein MurJ [Cellulomonas dongxiuzhuiae]
MSATSVPPGDPQDVPGGPGDPVEPLGGESGADDRTGPRGGVRRGAALMASGTAVSRLLGFLRLMVLGVAIGATGQAADAFSVANKLPNVLFMLLAGGVLNAVLVPQVVRAYKRHAGQEYVDRLLTFGFALLAGASVLLTLAAPVLVRVLADPDSDAQIALTTAFAYWCIPQLFFYGAYALLGQVLNARGSFGPYMWAPVVNNIVSIAGFGLFYVLWGQVDVAEEWGAGQIALFGGSATLGVVCQAIVLVPFLRRAGVRYRWRWGVRGSGLGRAGNVATWTFVGLAIGLLGYVVVSRVASAAPGGAAGPATDVAGNAAYDYAFALFMLPHSLVTVSLATALFTRLSAQAHDGDVAGVRGSLSSGLRVVGLFTLLAGAGLVVLAEPVVRLLLFSQPQGPVDAVAGVVIAMAVGLPAFGAWSMCQRVYYAYEDAKGMVPVQIAMAAVVVAGTLLAQALLPHRAWVAGAGLSMSVSYVLGTVLAMRALRGRLGGRIDGAHVLRTHARAGLAALAAAGVGYVTLLALRSYGPGDLAGAVLQCAVVGVVMSLTYLGALRLLHVRELDQLLGPVLRRLRARR